MGGPQSHLLVQPLPSSGGRTIPMPNKYIDVALYVIPWLLLYIFFPPLFFLAPQILQMKEDPERVRLTAERVDSLGD